MENRFPKSTNRHFVIGAAEVKGSTDIGFVCFGQKAWNLMRKATEKPHGERGREDVEVRGRNLPHLSHAD